MENLLKTQYFIKTDVSIFGPFSAGQVIKLVKTNQVVESDSVSAKHEGPWVNAGSVKQLQPFFFREKDVESRVLGGLADDDHMSGNYQIVVERFDDLDLPVEKLQQIYKLTEGPVQWLNNGVYMFSAPKNVSAVSVDGEYVFFEGSLTGAPLAEIELSEPVYMASRGGGSAFRSEIIGIDLGTTNSVVAVVEGGVPIVIPNLEGNRLTPSVMAYVDGAEIHVGEPAQRQAVTNPTRTIRSIKRLMGRRFNEISHNDLLVSYKVSKSDSGYVEINVDDNSYSPQEISAKILRKLKASAESYLGHKVNKAVVTVPAYFNDSQRQATKNAGQMAGLEIERLINEPTAAALAYGLGKKPSERVIVFDLGGGSCDVSVLEIENAGDSDNECRVVEVLSTAGNTQLGGGDFDAALMNHFADAFHRENGVDLRNDAMALQRLYEACEKAKKELSSVSQTDISLPFITADDSGPKHMQMTITRSTFEEMIDSLVDKCRTPVERALKDAGVSASDIDEVVLVGGSTRIPKVREMVVSLFGKEPHQGVNPDEVVAMGAAIQGGVLAGDITDVLLLDVTPFTVGIETEGGVITALVDRNTSIPAEKKNVFSTAADNQAAVTVKVFQGERKMAKDNRLLGEFNLEGISPAPRGVPQIEVTFDLDQNGILNVTAKDLGTKKQSTIRIEDSAERIHQGAALMNEQLIEHPHKTCTLEIAERYLADENNGLYGFTNISVEAAEALAECKELLFLDGLTNISVEVAAALGKGEGWLSLGGLTNISVEVAEALAKCEGSLSLDGLFLDGLTNISVEVAAALSKSEGSLSLGGLTSISVEAAEALAKCEGSLHLDDLTNISEPAAKILRDAGHWE